jgi:hypothetical protein
MYHERCLVAAEGTGPTGAEYKCKECTDKGYHQLNLPADLKLLYVEWQPHGEALDTVRASGTPASQAQLETKLREQEERADERPPKRRPVEVSRQTIMPDDTERVYDITIGQLIRQKLVIHTQPINPHADTAPTGACCAYVRNVLHGNPEQGQDVCCIYGVDGRCEHMLRPEVAERLRLGYKHMQDKFPETMERLQAGTFEEELRRVCIRYKQDGNTTAEKARYWSIPEELKHALMSGIKAVSERFSSPLTAHMCDAGYWTAHARDQVFGARFNAYSSRWTGSSLAVPEFTAEAATRAVDWAIQSALNAREDDPTLTLLLLPTYFSKDDDTTYMQLVRRNPAQCLPIGTFFRDAIELMPPANMPFAEPMSLKWKFRLIAVGNKAGYDKFLPRQDSEWLKNFQSQVEEACRPSKQMSRTIEFETVHAWRNVWGEKPAANRDEMDPKSFTAIQK